MFTISKSVLLSVLAASAKTSSVFAEPGPVARIVGGNQAEPGDYPYFVEMGTCGGALIAPDAVLFAAHCGDWKDQQINIGAYRTQTLEEGAQERFCDVWIPDPKYGTEGSDINYDFALCKLNEPVIIDESNVVLVLNEEDSVPATGEDLQVMGLGALASGGSSPEYVHEVTVPTVSNEECNAPNSYDGEITDIMLCAGFPDEGGKDSCQGDSGGPIVKRTFQNGKFVDTHVGVVSWGYGCADVNFPGVYARTSKRADWIKQTVCDDFESTASFCSNTPPAPEPCANELTINILTDRWAYESEMTLIDSSSTEVLKRKYLIKQYNNEHKVCLEANTCYVWTLGDRASDGINNGSYSLALNGQTVASGNGNFGREMKENFCTADGNPVASPTEAPVPSPTEAPVAPTEAPVAPTVAPVAPTVAPVAPTVAPVAPTDEPTPLSTQVDSEDQTDFPTDFPTFFPTDSPTEFDFCKDSIHFFFKDREDRTCEWVGRGGKKKVKRKCKKTWYGVKVYDWCPTTCGEKAKLGYCA